MLFQGDEEADDDGEEGNTFYEGGGDDHSAADVAGSFGLTSDTFHSTLADFTDTETGTNSSQTSAYSSAKET